MIDAQKLPLRLKRFGLIAGPLLALLVFFILPTEGASALSAPGRKTAALMVLMALWWMTEALPLAMTALLPLLFFPLLGIAPIAKAASPYADPVIFLFMGGFMMALTMQRWNLHQRIALYTLKAIGTRPKRLLAGIMASTGFISMWVSNTATVVMMLPIATSLIALVDAQGESAAPNEKRNFALAVLLGTAYAASIGGVGTLIGTPPNALFAAFVQREYGQSVSFGNWMKIGLPVVILFLPLTWFLLARILFRFDNLKILGGAEYLKREIERIGSVSPAEKRILAVFCLTAFLWIALPLLKPHMALGPLAYLDDTGVAILGAVLFFLLPSGNLGSPPLLNWEWAEKLPWEVLILFGGGLTLSSAMSANGVSAFLAGHFVHLQGFPDWWFVVAATTVVIFMTELTSNTATCATFLPIMASVAKATGIDPYLLLVPVTLASSYAFMLPVGTPPNALVYGTGRVSIAQMCQAGWWLNLIGIVVITVVALALHSVLHG